MISRRIRWIGGAALVCAAVCGCGGSSGQTGSGTRTTASGPGKAAVPATTTTATTTTQHAAGVSRPARPSPPPAPSPGSLPQDLRFPSSATPGFHAEMDALWQGVRTGSLAAAMPAFFPEGAYVQLKSIGDPAGDYTGRLVRDYGLDIGAAHALLGAHAAGAQLVGVEVPSGHIVPIGVCDNRVAYYEVPDPRMVYREDGETRSFGIASMISWRGVWYVIHFGAILRSSDQGVVDSPTTGPGESVPSSTC